MTENSALQQWPAALQQHFGFAQLRPGQQPVVEAILSGRSAAAIFPTGSGKSLCYQLPALLLPHLTLVISPLLALMQDQVAFLQSKGIAAATIDSSQSREQSQQIMADVRSGKIKILMISVERLKNERFRQFIEQIAISLLVVDEAHCISEWGHNFRPDYLKLPDYRQQFAIPQVLLLTATATEKVVADMRARFAIAEGDVITTGFYRHNLRLLVQPTPNAERKQKCLQWLQHLHTKQAQKNEPWGSVIYVTQQQTAEEVAEYLSAHISTHGGIAVKAYHAGLGSELREQIQTEFMAGTTPCIVATIAFGMGVDKSNIRQVMHYDLPKSIENYSQEIGRAGRDGKAADCIMLADQSGYQVLENFVYGDTPELNGIETVLNTIRQEMNYHNGHQRWEVLLTPLSNASNIRLLTLKTLLVNLEMRGILKAQFSYFAEYKFKLAIGESQWLNHFDVNRQHFLQDLLNCCDKGKTWYSLNSEKLVQNLGEGARKRALSALEYCQEQGWLELQSKQMTDVYQVAADLIAQPDLGRELFDHFHQREGSETARLQAMLELLQTSQCLSRTLAQYFNDHAMTQDCGHCSVCMGKHQSWPALPQQPLPDLTQAPLNSDIQALQQALTSKNLPGASEALIARYLCGIAVPWLNRVQARKLPGFGRLAQVPYQQVLAAVTKK